MIDAIKQQIFGVFYKFGYKMGSLVGGWGSSLMTSGFMSGLQKKMAEGINSFVNYTDDAGNDTFGEMIESNMNTILTDFIGEISDDLAAANTLIDAEIAANMNLDLAAWEAEAEQDLANL